MMIGIVVEGQFVNVIPNYYKSIFAPNPIPFNLMFIVLVILEFGR